MKKVRAVHLIAAMLIAGPALGAQTTGPQSAPNRGPSGGVPDGVKNTAKQIVSVFKAPLHPVIKGVASGGGLGAGLGYDLSLGGHWEADARAVITRRRYWSAQAGVEYETDRLQGQLYGRVRDMTRLNYFGPGTDSELADRSNFALRDQVLGAHAALRATDWLTLGARVEDYLPDVGRGRATSLPSIEERFDESLAPGLLEQPRFARYQGSVEVTLPAPPGEAFYQGAKYRATYAYFDDRRLDQYSFHRMEVEARHRFAIFGPHRRLTLRGLASTTETETGNDVPFYLQRTLGGKSVLRSVDEDFLGGDGTQASLRGFTSYRFRDRHLMLLQAEYRIPIWGPFDATLFADAGKVASRREDLDFTNLKNDYGFSLSMMRASATLLRLDVAFGSGEGTRYLISIGSDILP